MVANSPRCLARAAARARQLGELPLAAYFSNKAVEETGHDKWAEHDLRVLRSSFAVEGDDRPVPATTELLRAIEATIEQDPALYLAYVLWAEYFMVLMGGDLISGLVERCGIPHDALTCVAKHVVLDEEHATEGLDAVDAFVTDPRKLSQLRAVLRQKMSLFDRACAEMVELPLARAAS